MQPAYSTRESYLEPAHETQLHFLKFLQPVPLADDCVLALPASFYSARGF